MAKSDRKKPTSGVVHGPRCPLKGEIKQHLTDYASTTTTHGLFYIAEPGQSWAERIFWIFVVFLAISFSYYQTHILYKEWQDYPVITTLDTVSLPIEEIDFPAVTICPQGSIKSIAETVLFHQLADYIRQKENSTISRKKRSDSTLNATTPEGMNNEGPWKLTYHEMMIHVDEFLRDVYPGAKDKPTKLVHLLTSNQPRKMLANDAVMYQSFEEVCDAESNEETLKMLNQNLNNETCPIGFSFLEGIGCIHTAGTQMAYNEAKEYCAQLEESVILEFGSKEELEVLKLFFIRGKTF